MSSEGRGGTQAENLLSFIPKSTILEYQSLLVGGLVWSGKLPPAVASTVILNSESRGTQT
jgi:hypothetical protein